MKRVFLALPVAAAVAAAIRKRLKRKKLAKRLEVVERLDSAQIVVTSSDDIGTLPERLPESVELLQLVDCGGGLRYRGAPNLTITNASSFYASQVATLAWSIVHERSRMRQAFGTELIQLGLVGVGNVGRSLLQQLYVSNAIPIYSSNAIPNAEYQKAESARRIFGLDRVVVKDFRTRYRHFFDSFLQTPSELIDFGLRWMPLDQLLSTSDVVVVAVHRGPTADPLLGERETRLLDPRAWVVDVSENGVVDPSAFTTHLDLITGGEDHIDPTESGASDQLLSGPVHMRVSSAMRERTCKEVAKFVGWNLRRFARGRWLHAVEPVARGSSAGECGR